jgi:hypothetical protein
MKNLLLAAALLLTAAPALAGDPPRIPDAPVKAEPDPYDKICDAYGVGYKRIPGTDTCVKIGGYIRLDATGSSGSGGPPPPPPSNPPQ